MDWDGAMLSDRLRQWRRVLLALPEQRSPEDQRVAASLRNIGLLLSVVGFGWLVASFFVPGSWMATVIATANLGVIVTSLVLVYTGRTRLGATILVGGVWLGCTLAASFTGGVSAPAVQAYTVGILAAGLLIGRQASLWMAALCATAAVVLAFLEVEGRLPHLIVHTPWSILWVQISIFSVASFLLFDALGRVREAIARTLQSEERAHRLFEQAADAIFVFNLRGRCLDANLQACQLSGYTRDELLALPIRELLPEPQPATYARDLEVLSRHETMSEQRILRRKDGSPCFVEGRTRLLSDGRLEIIARDVTDRIEAQRLSRQLRIALDHASEGIVVFDENERLVYANPSFQDMYNSSVDFEGRPSFHELATDPVGKRLLVQIHPMVTAGRSWAGRVERHRRNGERVVRDATFTPICGPTGEVMGFVGVARDVSREVELEASLRHSQKMEAVGRLAGGVAHDFNNLLTAILGFAELLESSLQGDPVAHEEVTHIREAAKQAAKLTAELLAFGRKQVVQPEILDLNELVRGTAAMLRRIVREDVQLELALAADLPWVEADPNQLRQVLLNLAANARDAMPRGGRFEIRTGERTVEDDAQSGLLRPRPGRYAMLSVIDTGEGMDAETRERIFEPFFTTKPVGKGTGLGLASVHGIVEQSGGAIEVESAPGKGATFRILLPAATRDAGLVTRSAPKAFVTTPGRVLLVEDQDRVRGVVARALRSAGYQVFEASDGENALAILEEVPAIDLLLTDLIMPKLDGRSLAMRLRGRWPDLRVLFTSGYAQEGDSAWLQSNPNADFLAKPFTSRELIEAVQRILGAS